MSNILTKLLVDVRFFQKIDCEKSQNLLETATFQEIISGSSTAESSLTPAF
jgi:hypothetical protein